MSEKITDSIAQQVKDFFNRFAPREFNRGQIIVDPGDDPPGIMYIEKGVIGQFDIAKNGSKIGVNSFKPGAFCPMSWAINLTPNKYYYEAILNVSIRVAPRELVLEWLDQNPRIVHDLLSRVYKGLDGLLEQHTILLGSSARARVLFSLILHARRFGVAAENGTIRIHVTEVNLSQQAGVSRETVSRQLRELKNSGNIHVSRGVIDIRNLQYLELELANER